MVHSRLEVEKKFAIDAQTILTAHGFSDVSRGPATAPYDFTAKKDGKKCFIEMKSRSPQARTQFFAFRQSQLMNLKKLAEKEQVFILLINKYGYKLVSLEEFLGLKDGIYTFKCYFEKKKPRNVYYWSPLGWKGNTHIKSDETRTIHIRLSNELITKLEEEAWRLFGSRKISVSLLVEKRLRESYSAVPKTNPSS
jgi:hypothetical protein